MTKHIVSALSLLVVLGAASTALAQPKDELAPLSTSEAPKPPRAQLGVRIAVAVPMGDLDARNSLDDALGTTFTTDLMLDLRVATRVILTPYVGFAKGSAGNAVQKMCDQTHVTCAQGGLQAGGMLRFAYARTSKVEAWIGYAFSREWRYAGGGSVAASFAGNEHHLLTGVDFFVKGASKMGLYAEIAGGTYDSAEMTVGDVQWTPRDPGEHRWMSVGFQTFF
ncbi:MAG: hypothetical protein ACXVCJ_26375 [Polyangiales bacterium]